MEMEAVNLKVDSVEFDVIPQPTATITAPNEICLGDTITLNGVMTNKTGQNWSILSGTGSLLDLH